MEIYNIEYHKSSPYQPQTNGAVEIANKNIKNILAKMVVKYKDWLRNFHLPYRVTEPDSVEPWHWKLYFDGATNSTGNGVGAVLVSPKGQQILVSIKLNFDCTNNVIQVALEFGAYDLSVLGDSLLIISQIKGKWQAQDTKLIPYQKCVNCLIPKFQNITFTYLPWAHNQFTDAMATLASMVKLSERDDM